MKPILRKMLLMTAGMLCINGLQAQSLPPFLSVQSVGSAGSDQQLYLKTDTAGNIYSSGFITASSATFGSFTLNAPPPTASFNYVAKQDASGTYQWAIALPKYNISPTDAWKIYMTTDPAGNVYTTGAFMGSITFGSTTLTAPGTDFSTYITKQATDGSYTWAIMITDPGAGGGSSASGIFADSLGSVYLSGAFSGTIDIDPGAGTVNLTASTSNGRNVYTLKLNNAGDYVWARAITGSGLTSGPTPITITADNAGNVYTTGIFYINNLSTDSIDFDPGPGTYNLTISGPDSRAHYISKLDANGNHLWTRAVGNSTPTVDLKSVLITTDVNGNVYATGWFDGTADFDPGPGTATLTAKDGARDPFMLKLDSAGNYRWVKQLYGTNISYFYGLQLDGLGNLYSTGLFTDTTDFDPNVGVANLIAAATNNIFVAKWDTAGNYIDAVGIGNTATDFGRGLGLVVNNTGTKVSVTGYFSGTMDFDPGAGTHTITSTGGNDIFYLTLGPLFPLPITLSSFNAYAEGSSAQLNWITASEEGNKGFEIQHSTNGSNWQRIGYMPSLAERGNSSQELHYNFTDHAPAAGVNYYRLKQENVDGKSSFSQVRLVSFNSDHTISIYPNPAKDKLYLSGMNGGETVTIYCITGQVIKTGSISSAGTSVLSLHELPAGIYYLKILSQSGQNSSFKLAIAND